MRKKPEKDYQGSWYVRSLDESQCRKQERSYYLLAFAAVTLFLLGGLISCPFNLSEYALWFESAAFLSLIWLLIRAVNYRERTGKMTEKEYNSASIGLKTASGLAFWILEACAAAVLADMFRVKSLEILPMILFLAAGIFCGKIHELEKKVPYEILDPKKSTDEKL